MRNRLLVGIGVLVVVALAVTIFVFTRRGPAPQGGPAAGSESAAQTRVPPPIIPALTLEVDAADQVELRQGTPFVLTVRISNPRAANAAAANESNALLVAELQQRVSRGQMTAAAAQPMIEGARQQEPVETIRAGAAERGWESFLHFERVDGNSAKRLDWPLKAIAPPPSRAIELGPASVGEIQYAMPPESAAQLPIGKYQVVAAFEVAADASLPAGTWRGRVTSRPVTIGIAATTPEPTGAERVAIDLQRAEFFATTQDWKNAAQAAERALAQDSQLIRGQIVLGQAREGMGDLRGARDAFMIARGLFDEQHPNSYERPEYLDLKINQLNQKLGLP